MTYRSNKQSEYNVAYRGRRMLLYAFFFITFFLFHKTDWAQTTLNDTNSVNSVFNNQILQSTYVSLPLFAGTCIFKNKDVNFRQMRNGIIPNFRYDYDTYLQFVPLGLTYALKSFGFKSHSSWLQLGLNTLLSYGLGYGTAKIIKENHRELRPDWGGVKSFPSGHTTIAFVSASVLSKEYSSEYPWLGVAGYTAATVTGLSRVMNNRHWLHDVMAGAGIGMIATELSYALTDFLFNNKQHAEYSPTLSESKNAKPNYLNVYIAYSYCLNNYPKETSRRMPYTINNGSALGIESAYYFNTHFGVSIRAKSEGYWLNNHSIEWPADSVFSSYSFDVSANISYPLFHRIYAGFRTGYGLSYVPQKLIQYYIVLPKQTHGLYTAGIFANLQTDKHTFLRLYADYDYTRLKIDDKTQSFSILLLGASIGLHF